MMIGGFYKGDMNTQIYLEIGQTFIDGPFILCLAQHLVLLIFQDTLTSLFKSSMGNYCVALCTKIVCCRWRGLKGFFFPSSSPWDSSLFQPLHTLLRIHFLREKNTSTWASRRLMSIMMLVLIYYKIPYGAASLEFNLYQSVIFNSLSEIPIAILSTILVSNFGS